jgi:hypothetical protein
MGIGTCEAAAMNATLLTKVTEVGAYVNAHSNFAVAVTTMVTGMTHLATQVYQYLSNPANAALIYQQLPDIQSKLPAVLANPQMLKDISNPSANTYIPTKLGASLLNAPLHLCGGVFYLATVASYNMTNPTSPINYYFTISNGGNYLAIGGATIDSYFAVTHSNIGAQWQVQSLNPQPPFSLGSTLVYTASTKQYMIISNTSNYAIDQSFEVQVCTNLSSTTDGIRWKMEACANAQGQTAVIFSSMSIAYSNSALANNSGSLYNSYNTSDPNQQWLIFFTYQ